MENEVFDAGQIYAYTPEELGELFGVDALLYSTVTEWRTTYLVAYAVIEVGARFELVDARTDTVLWKWEKSLADRRVGYDRDTLAETAVFALTPYQPYVTELVRMAFATLPWH